jgi:phosphoglycolate phosphatase-like HAD superfamily hydrolase
MLQEAEIFDMDGTLCDVRSIRHYVTGPERNFHAFHVASASCPPHPHVVEGARRARREGRAVLVVTARLERYRRLTSMWLALHEVPSDDLLMRPDDDFRKDYLVKRDILARIRRRYQPVKAWDDNPAVIQLWKEEGVPYELVPGWEEQ